MAELHTLQEYVEALRTAGILESTYVDEVTASLPISCLTYDSRKVEGSALFIVKGAHFKPDFLRNAIAQGAVAYVAAQAVENVLTPAIIVNDIRTALVVLGQLFYDHPTQALTTVGITGTKGKSTTTYYLRAILSAWLKSLGKQGPAILSSIKNFDGEREEEAHLTTPEPLELYEHFATARRAGISTMVMEVSSQALKYGRVRGMHFAVAAFTNISEDHISPIEHSDFEDYYTSKLKIFDAASVAVVNADADLAERTLTYARERCDVLTYGSSPEYSVCCPPESIHNTPHGIEFQVISSSYTGNFMISMPGRFNVSNALCAIAIAGELGVPEEFVRSGLRAAQVPGRMEMFHSRDERIVAVVDYAHNRLSYEAVLNSIHHEYPGYPLVAVCGATGIKALDRRRDIGEVMSAYCAKLYITEDDSYTEPFESIAAEIARYTTIPYEINQDRVQSIHAAMIDFPGKHVVLVLGKGEENTQARGTEYVRVQPDSDIVRGFITEYDAHA